MAEVVLGRWHPTPGQSLETFEVPGPGIYEADFRIPDWLFPDFTNRRRITQKVGEHVITHVSSAAHGDVLTVRFIVEKAEGTAGSAPYISSGPVLFLWAVVGVFAAIVGTLVLKTVIELRKIAQTPAGLGLAALGIGAGALLLVTAWKGR